MSVSYGGTVSAINQANSVGQQDNSIQAGISQLNNANLSSYNLLQQGEETKDAGLESEKLAQLGGYTSAIGEKYKEYQDFIKEGGDVKKLKSVKLLDGVADSITGAFGSDGFKANIDFTRDPIRLSWMRDRKPQKKEMLV